MDALLCHLIKLWRDAGYPDLEIADMLLYASKKVRAGKYWPSELK
jgi:hypothetical protein